jgi:hypothetical protein
MILDARVAARLRHGRVVNLAVSVTTIANEIDDDVGVEGRAIVRGQSGDADNSFGVLCVDVEDGNRQALGEVRGEARAVGLFRKSGETEQVVDDHLNGSADFVTMQRGEIQRLCPNALSGEGCVAVNDERKNLLHSGFSETFLIGARAAHDHRVGSFQMAWIRGEMQMDDLAVRSDELAGCADVVLHVAAAHGAARVDVLELGEDLRASRGQRC